MVKERATRVTEEIDVAQREWSSFTVASRSATSGPAKIRQLNSCLGTADGPTSSGSQHPEGLVDPLCRCRLGAIGGKSSAS
jgi:hypothetical protein